MTNNPLKVEGLRNNGIEVSDRVTHISGICASNRNYLNTKRVRMGHLLDIE
jgi:GTP cyclohydrolase II